MSADFLELMARSSRERVARARQRCPEQVLLRQARAAPPAPVLTLSELGFDLIAEFKLRSPALGALEGTGADIAARVRGYADAGAAAISILTEPSRFDGALAHLERSAQLLTGRIPVMRKDFLIDPYQVYEARAAGAGGVLVILRMLSSLEQRALIEACMELGLFALLEAFDADDLERAAELVGAYGSRTALLVGVNCRDLGTLEVVPGRCEALAARLPPGVPHVAESGIRDGADAARLVRAGYDVALVGSALMQSADSAGLMRLMLAAGRAAAEQGLICGSEICGMTDPEAVSAALAVEVDAIGFVFAASVRCVQLAEAVALAAPARGRCTLVAVTLHPAQQFVDEILRVFKPDALQSDWADLDSLRLPVTLPRLPVLRSGEKIGATLPARMLFEGGVSGSGTSADWSQAASLARATDVILAGGLSARNVEEAIHAVQPFGVDVSSGVESAPGRKSPRMIAQFVQAARAAARDAA